MKRERGLPGADEESSKVTLSFGQWSRIAKEILQPGKGTTVLDVLCGG